VIDVKLLRTEPDAVRAAMARRGKPDLLEQLDQAAAVDGRLRQIANDRDAIRRQVNDLSKQVGQLRREGRIEDADAAQRESRALGGREGDLANAAAAAEAELRDLLLRIPNLPHPDAPEGASEEDNPVVKGPVQMPVQWGDHQRLPHWEIGSALGILDTERAVKISGSMFAMLRGQGATMSRALCQLALDRNADAFEEIRPPSLVTTATLTATGQLPKFADDAYAIERDDLWCIPTAEVPLTSIGRDEIVDEATLPLRYMAYTPCYRREAGSAGKDTRGLLRVHEFDKVEILAYSTGDQGPALLTELVDRAERTIAALGLAYRIIEICTGDMGQSHHRSFDIEVYAPGCDRWLEVSSVSWFSDYQGRRGNLRYRPTGAKGTEIAHTLNGSALATPRVLAAIWETYRQPDGSIAIPDVLLPYMRGARAIAAPVGAR
jgi:seryl-tRNA synthetase